MQYFGNGAGGGGGGEGGVRNTRTETRFAEVALRFYNLSNPTDPLQQLR